MQWHAGACPTADLYEHVAENRHPVVVFNACACSTHNITWRQANTNHQSLYLGGLPDPLHLSFAWKPHRLVRSRYSSCHTRNARVVRRVQGRASRGLWWCMGGSGKGAPPSCLPPRPRNPSLRTLPSSPRASAQKWRRTWPRPPASDKRGANAGSADCTWVGPMFESGYSRVQRQQCRRKHCLRRQTEALWLQRL